MESDSTLCNFNILETNIKSLQTFNDLLLKNNDPTLCALNDNEDTEDGTQLGLFKSHNSMFDIKFKNDYKLPLLTIPKALYENIIESKNNIDNDTRDGMDNTRDHFDETGQRNFNYDEKNKISIEFNEIQTNDILALDFTEKNIIENLDQTKTIEINNLHNIDEKNNKLNEFLVDSNCPNRDNVNIDNKNNKPGINKVIFKKKVTTKNPNFKIRKIDNKIPLEINEYFVEKKYVDTLFEIPSEEYLINNVCSSQEIKSEFNQIPFEEQTLIKTEQSDIVETSESQIIDQGFIPESSEELLSITPEFHELAGVIQDENGDVSHVIINACDNNMGDANTVTNENEIIFENGNEQNSCTDGEDEVMEALATLGIHKDYFDNTTNTSGKKHWVCPIEECTFTTIKLYTFKIHLLKHFNVRPFKCKYRDEIKNINCEWGFYCKSKLQRHFNVHVKTDEYICNYENCGKVYYSIDNIMAHIKRHEKSLNIKCDIDNCNRTFTTNLKYELHKKVHENVEAPYKCEYKQCKKSFYTVCSLQAHCRMHVNDVEDLKCSECKKQFTIPCRLREHMDAVHKHIKKYKCTVDNCKWAFATNSKLRRHLKSHKNLREFKCEVGDCNRRFLRLDHLQDHLRIHSENRTRFICSYQDCLLPFYAKSSLYAHIKKVHGKIYGRSGKNIIKVPFTNTISNSTTSNIISNSGASSVQSNITEVSKSLNHSSCNVYSGLSTAVEKVSSITPFNSLPSTMSEVNYNSSITVRNNVLNSVADLTLSKVKFQNSLSYLENNTKLSVAKSNIIMPSETSDKILSRSVFNDLSGGNSFSNVLVSNAMSPIQVRNDLPSFPMGNIITSNFPYGFATLSSDMTSHISDDTSPTEDLSDFILEENQPFELILNQDLDEEILLSNNQT